MTRYRTLHVLAKLVGVVMPMLLLSQCSDDPTGPVGAGSIKIFSGDNQTSLKGTELAEPLVVVIKTSDGAAAQKFRVVFSVIEGGGSVVPATAQTDEFGRTSTRLTLGPDVGTNRVRAEVDGADGSKKSVVFTASAGDYYCPEADPNLSVSYGSRGDLFLATPKSAAYPDNSAGIVLINPDPAFSEARGWLEIPPFAFTVSVIWDAAFSPRGDFFVSRRLAFNEIIKVATDRSVTVFSGIEDMTEIAANPVGLLIGCDAKGPFVVGCRDTIQRYPEATFASGVNNDALAVDPRRQAVDPLGEDIYFIYKPDSTLRRLPMDSLTVTGALQVHAGLSKDEADNANGMVCDQNGNVYILVDSATRKALLRVTPAGNVSELFNFFDRGAGTAAGVQNDLALSFPYLYTVDTENNRLLRYDINADALLSLVGDPFDRTVVSSATSSGERVGLDVLR